MRALAAALIAGAAWTPAPGAGQPFTVHDLLGIARISDPRASPDGARVAFVVETVELARNRTRTDLWLVDLAGGAPRQVAPHPAGTETSPRWSADGRALHFLSSRSGSSQVWRIDASGEAPQQATGLPLDVQAFALAPDGRILASVDAFADCADLACSANRVAAVRARAATGQLYDHLFVRRWDEWSDHRHRHLVVVPRGVRDGVRDLMAGLHLDADSPPRPSEGTEPWAFTPDGGAVVFSARGEAGAAWTTDFDLYLARLDGVEPPRRLTSSPAADTLPTFSPDGATLAYLAQARPGYEADRYRIVSRGWPSGEERVLTERWDRSAGRPSWSADGRELYWTAQDRGGSPIFSVGAHGGEVRQRLSSGTVRWLSVAGDRLVFTAEGLEAPPELCSARPDGTDLRVHTHFNDELLRQGGLGRAKRFRFAGWREEAVEGFVVRPPHLVAGRRYPVALVIHGGPQSSHGDEFPGRWNLQVFAGAGFGVVEVEFHGSTGYGQAFTDSIQGDRGGKPLEDLRRGLAAALALNPWMDPGRVCALGASYGGYLANWIEGAWPDRFRCLVSHGGSFDERAAYFTTDELSLAEHDHRGPPWAPGATYERFNPVNLVGRWRTPMLVVQGGRDFRVAETQSLATFTALQRRGIPSRLLYFPDESHWVSSPQNVLLWHDVVLDWLRRWTCEPVEGLSLADPAREE